MLQQHPIISVIIPTLNEAQGIVSLLATLAPVRAAGGETLVVDGDSSDGTAGIAAPHADRVLSAPRGRAAQMNAGAVAARGDLLVFLHADTRPPIETLLCLPDLLARSGRSWGRFDVRIDGRHPLLPLVAWSMNQRSRLTGIATGDQAIFVDRALFERVGGYLEIALMEDIALSRELKHHGPPLCVRNPVVTSGRRWESKGVVRTVLLMWSLRLAYALGVYPDRLSRIYGHRSRPD
ncbi:TIGR04283 family arsenosugar biosynthesis glycosyltransferase [Thiocapsa roseopersicina]|uniref:Transferase 2, rSAM/selenodomain-associated n=1 Tax=Thiocapsa roseopersicina TaxID=1058 RepID=A0A1H2QUJ0_THIRO|nr:TIGR04283 family arsenosugar biosynthesis glycosyltransferase [Thiocapsa roseopersicina]SDW10795.1 transferase 2, rSAM/selenodomain-associated [Thiocapsa roseopersicina]